MADGNGDKLISSLLVCLWDHDKGGVLFIVLLRDLVVATEVPAESVLDEGESALLVVK